jgi:hypothetical protein
MMSRQELKAIYENCFCETEIPVFADAPAQLYMPWFVKEVHTTTSWFTFDHFGTKSAIMQAVVHCNYCNNCEHYASQICNNCSASAPMQIESRWVKDIGPAQWARILTPENLICVGIPCIVSLFGLGYCFFYNNNYYVIINNVMFIAEELSAKWLQGHSVWENISGDHEKISGINAMMSGDHEKMPDDLGIHAKYADCYGNIYDCKLYRESFCNFYVITNINDMPIYVCPKIAQELYNKFFNINGYDIVLYQSNTNISPVINIPEQLEHREEHKEEHREEHKEEHKEEHREEHKEETSIIPIPDAPTLSPQMDADIRNSAKKSVLQVLIKHFPVDKYFIDDIGYIYTIKNDVGFLPLIAISITVKLKTPHAECKNIDTKNFIIPFNYDVIIRHVIVAVRHSAHTIINDPKYAAIKAITLVFKNANAYFAKNKTSFISINDYTISLEHRLNDKANLIATLKISAQICIHVEQHSYLYQIHKHGVAMDASNIYKKSYLDSATIIRDTAESAAKVSAENVVLDKQLNNIHTGLSLAKHEFDIIAIITIIKSITNHIYIKSNVIIDYVKKTVAILYVLMNNGNLITEQNICKFSEIMRKLQRDTGHKCDMKLDNKYILMDYVEEKIQSMISKA